MFYWFSCLEQRNEEHIQHATKVHIMNISYNKRQQFRIIFIHKQATHHTLRILLLLFYTIEFNNLLIQWPSSYTTLVIVVVVVVSLVNLSEFDKIETCFQSIKYTSTDFRQINTIIDN